jgi:hypothetical protein
VLVDRLNALFAPDPSVATCAVLGEREGMWQLAEPAKIAKKRTSQANQCNAVNGKTPSARSNLMVLEIR